MPETNTPNDFSDFNNRRRFFATLAAIFAVVVFTVFQLRNQGRIWWCKFGDFSAWSSDAWGKHNSQHLFDPYSFTHVLHGVLYFWLASFIFRKMPLAWRFFIALTVECAWEVIENSSFIIEHYRTATLALDYYGDSISNTLGDVLSCGIGFWLAYKLKFRRSLLLFLLIEIVLLITIHDSLLLNIVMLIHPIEALKVWQSNL
jgi:hypothetical protein